MAKKTIKKKAPKKSSKAKLNVVKINRPVQAKKPASVQIGKHVIGHDQPVFFIAEIGINHNGDINLVKKLVDAAIVVGCNAIKFQKRTVPIVYTAEELAKPRVVHKDVLMNAVKRGVLSPEAVKRLTSSNFEQATNGDLKWALELSKDEYAEIDRYAREKGITWFASCWDEDAVDFIDQFNPPVYKIASASLTDKNLLKHTRSKGKPIILSTGMSDMDMVKDAVLTLGSDNLILMHTVSTYPAALHELNLQNIHTLRDEFENIPIGYSGHEVGMGPAVAAAIMGACVIERHITLDRSMWGSDQAASVEPKGFLDLTSDIREWEIAKGDHVKKILESEKPIMAKLRRK